MAWILGREGDVTRVRRPSEYAIAKLRLTWGRLWLRPVGLATVMCQVPTFYWAWNCPYGQLAWPCPVIVSSAIICQLFIIVIAIFFTPLLSTSCSSGTTIFLFVCDRTFFLSKNLFSFLSSKYAVEACDLKMNRWPSILFQPWASHVIFLSTIHVLLTQYLP